VTAAGPITKDKVRRAAESVLGQELSALAAAGDLTLHEQASELGLVLAEGLERAGLLSLTGETAIALELVAAEWPPVRGDLAEAAVHGIHLGGIMLSGLEDHVADYLRVMQSQHSGDAPQSLDHYRGLARRLRLAYREAVPDLPDDVPEDD
jgi:hypothetical protein